MRKTIHGRSVIRSLLCLLAGGAACSCGSVTNYIAPDNPRYAGHYAIAPSDRPDTIKVVTYNIQFAEKIDRAIRELRDIPELRGAGIILLQEMDASGTERIAEAFHFNYVYYPASVRASSGRDMGNAILSKWPIVESSKILLPHPKPFSKQRRIAVSAEILVGADTVLAYSIHTETVWLGRSKRLDQVKTIAGDIARHRTRHVIAGGDFNTWREKDIDGVTAIFAGEGLRRATEGAGPTFWAGRRLDHIFTRGLGVVETGMVKNTTASDHRPLWIILQKGAERFYRYERSS